MPELQQIYSKALALLTGREYCETELRARLKHKCPDAELEQIDAVIARLLADNYLSDERFCEVFVRSRRRKGQGPVRIQLELSRKGTAESLARAAVGEYDDWGDLAAEVACGRFAGANVTEAKEKARIWRFLSGRGFTTAHIQQALDAVRSSSRD